MTSFGDQELSPIADCQRFLPAPDGTNNPRGLIDSVQAWAPLSIGDKSRATHAAWTVESRPALAEILAKFNDLRRDSNPASLPPPMDWRAARARDARHPTAKARHDARLKVARKS